MNCAKCKTQMRVVNSVWGYEESMPMIEEERECSRCHNTVYVQFVADDRHFDLMRTTEPSFVS